MGEIDKKKDAVYYYADENNNLFVHGGYNWHNKIEGQPAEDLMWDRHLADTAVYWRKFSDDAEMSKYLGIDEYKKVFLGHTTVRRYQIELDPIISYNVILLDTGGGQVKKQKANVSKAKRYSNTANKKADKSLGMSIGKNSAKNYDKSQRLAQESENFASDAERVRMSKGTQAPSKRSSLKVTKKSSEEKLYNQSPSFRYSAEGQRVGKRLSRKGK